MDLLNEKERRVLESLFKLGQSTISAISKDTLVNRTALYHTIGLLTKKGLVTRLLKEKVSYYEAIPLDQYEKWAQSKIDSMKSTVGTDIKRFSAVRKEKAVSLYADVKYFEGLEALKNLYADTIYSNEEKMLYTITDYQKGYSTLGKWLEKEYLPERVRKGVRVRSIVPDTAFSRSYIVSAKALGRELCFVDLFKNLGIEINVYDSKIVIVAFDKTHPLGIIIKNDIIADAFREIFNYIWLTGKTKK
ncbi:MAG: Transcriptional regulator, TrmB [Candidatus Taylorbacteria bacterium]|nr:Transcriptional regulator, TrmB [Candidatus Taylorbacteria bacterium]